MVNTAGVIHTILNRINLNGKYGRGHKKNDTPLKIRVQYYWGFFFGLNQNEITLKITVSIHTMVIIGSDTDRVILHSK